MTDFDVIVIGSGPAGVHSADVALKKGLKVALISIGIEQEKKFSQIPKKNFSEIRKSESQQRSFFLGDHFEKSLTLQNRAGTHLTPPREYMIKNSDSIFPTESSVFFPLQATGRGGLGISWGANCFTYDKNELAKIGIEESVLSEHYQNVNQMIGVSGDAWSDTKKTFFNQDDIQPALPVDTNCSNILKKYRKMSRANGLNNFHLGQSFLSVLTENKDGRSANGLEDMDFWTNYGASVWRPETLLTTLNNNKNFTEITGFLVNKFMETPECAIITCSSIYDHSSKVFSAKKVFIACGAINSAKLVINSLGLFNQSFEILCNKNIWIGGINLSMLGKKSRDQRYSLSQLTGFHKNDQDEIDLVAHFYSYRSLLLYRLIPQIPLPPRIALYFLRLIVNCLTLINVQYESSFENSEYTWEVNTQNELKFKKKKSVADGKLFQALEKKIKNFLLKLRCVPVSISRPMDGASLHYAGTLAGKNIDPRAKVNSDGALAGHERIFVVDSSHWLFLPAKGLTYTLMANARRITQHALERI